jgi:hypothetical protein
MTPETIKQIQEALTPLAQKLGQGAEKVFELAIKQNYVYAAQGAVFIVFTAVSSLVYYKFCKWGRKKKGSYTNFYHHDWAPIIGWLGAVILAFCVVISIATIGGIIGRLINPEWYAIRDLINTVKMQTN